MDPFTATMQRFFDRICQMLQMCTPPQRKHDTSGARKSTPQMAYGQYRRVRWSANLLMLVSKLK